MLDEKPALTKVTAIHFHYGPKLSGVGIFIDKVFTDDSLEWNTIHISRETFGGQGRYGTFLAGLRAILLRPERIIFAHTLKAGLATALVKLIQPKRRFIYVGHGIRYFQKKHGSVRLLIAEKFVCVCADKIVHIRETDLKNARLILSSGTCKKLVHIRPKLSDHAVEDL